MEGITATPANVVYVERTPVQATPFRLPSSVCWVFWLLSILIGISLVVFSAVFLVTFVSMIPNTLLECFVELPRNISIHYFEKLVGKQRMVHYQEVVNVTTHVVVPYNPDVRITWSPYKIGAINRTCPQTTDYETIIYEFVIGAKSLFGSTLLWVNVNKYTTATVVLIGFVVIFVLWRIRSGLMRRARNVAWKLRGVSRIYQEEALMPGSEIYQDGSGIPNCQVYVYALGSWTETFVGCGTRIRDTLVIPHHVYASVRALDGGFLIKGKKNSVVLEGVPEQSEVLQDISYFAVPVNTWADLGVCAPSIPKDPTSARVSCSGKAGTSNGYLEFTEHQGFFRYSGSTKPGMSGAAYMAGNMCHGVHNGVIGGHNMGAMSVAIDIELSSMYYPEQRKFRPEMAGRAFKLPKASSPTISGAQGKITQSSFFEPLVVTRDRLAKALEQIRSGSNWADEEESATPTERLIKDVMQLDGETLRMLIPVLSQRAAQPSVMLGQTIEQAEILVENQTLVERVAKLEVKLQRIEQTLEESRNDNAKIREEMLTQISMVQNLKIPASEKLYVCEFEGCSGPKLRKLPRRFSTKDGLLAHQIAMRHVVSSCPKIPPAPTMEQEILKPESAFVDDNLTKADLGFRKPDPLKPLLAKKKGTSSENSSNTLDKTSPSTSTQVNLQGTQVTLMKMDKALEDFVKVLSGLKLGITQNLNH